MVFSRLFNSVIPILWDHRKYVAQGIFCFNLIYWSKYQGPLRFIFNSIPRYQYRASEGNYMFRGTIPTSKGKSCLKLQYYVNQVVPQKAIMSSVSRYSLILSIRCQGITDVRISTIFGHDILFWQSKTSRDCRYNFMLFSRYILCVNRCLFAIFVGHIFVGVGKLRECNNGNLLSILLIVTNMITTGVIYDGYYYFVGIPIRRTLEFQECWDYGI